MLWQAPYGMVQDSGFGEPSVLGAGRGGAGTGRVFDCFNIWELSMSVLVMLEPYVKEGVGRFYLSSSIRVAMLVAV